MASRHLPDDDRSKLARRSLEGLSVGDAFGDRFFTSSHYVERLIEMRALPAGLWPFTDDTAMAISVVEVLAEKGSIDSELLARLFAARYRLDPSRKYGDAASGVLGLIADGVPWREAASAPYGGLGSMGNGGAMRSAPIGAYFFDDFFLVVENARLSAEVTHAHPEGQAGAIAVAVAAAWMARGGGDPGGLFEVLLRHTPAGETRDGIARAASLPLSEEVRTAVALLGNGTQVISQDTVPFALWCAARHLGDYEEALWSTVGGLGDRDTTCAIVGGIVVLHPEAVIPADWLESREPLSALEVPVWRVAGEARQQDFRDK